MRPSTTGADRSALTAPQIPHMLVPFRLAGPDLGRRSDPWVHLIRLSGVEAVPDASHPSTGKARPGSLCSIGPDGFSVHQNILMGERSWNGTGPFPPTAP